MVRRCMEDVLKLPADLAAKILAMPGVVVGGGPGPVAGEVPAPSEKEFQSDVIDLAKRHGWMTYHTYDSRRSEPGFLDLVLLRGEVAIISELKKSESERLTAEQANWFEAWEAVRRIEVRLWTPERWAEIRRMIAAV